MKRAIVLSGGGFRVSFQIGALDYLINEYGLEYHIAAGISAGALNAALLAQKEFGVLKEIWLGLKKSRDLFRLKSLGLLKIFFKAKGIYENKPLEELLDKFIETKKMRQSGIELRVGVVDLQTGEFETRDQNDKYIKKFILASTAIPVIFDPVKIGSHQYVDGGLLSSIPLEAAVEAGAEEIVAITATNKDSASPSGKLQYENLLDIWKRGTDIIARKTSCRDMEIARNKAGKHMKLHIIEPDGAVFDYIGLDVLEFDRKKMQMMIEHGYEQARKIFPPKS